MMDGQAGMRMVTRGEGPHSGQRIAQAGKPLAEARQAVIMLHGRGAGPEDMLALVPHLNAQDTAFLAPSAAGSSWWSDSFLAPLRANEPYLSSALDVVERLVVDIGSAGLGTQSVVLCGFSQGACLALEATARLAVPFHAVAAFSGGLVGTAEVGGPPRDELYGRPAKAFGYSGTVDGVPILIGCHERDPHIPMARVRESIDVLGGMGAETELITIPGAGHGLVESEVEWLSRRLVRPAA